MLCRPVQLWVYVDVFMPGAWTLCLIILILLSLSLAYLDKMFGKGFNCLRSMAASGLLFLQLDYPFEKRYKSPPFFVQHPTIDFNCILNVFMLIVADRL